MKALIVGGGSRFGEEFTKLAKQDYEVHVITGSNYSDADRVIKVDWHFVELDDILPKIDKEYDLILFNQNGGGSPNGDSYSKETQNIWHWNRGFFNNVQLPYYILRHCELKKGNKVAWMLTPIMTMKMRHWAREWGGYAADKTYSAHIMKSFAYENEASFYGFVPKSYGDMLDLFAETIYNLIRELKPERSGELITETGETFTWR
tara:strand:- start:3833 stop:4447 length:615 start_codon:yes stop_codon:yes gene_type:complete